MAVPGLAPRQAALALLNRVTGEGRLLSELLPRALEQLPPEERARAQRLTLETLRWMDRADRLLGPHLKRRPAPPVLNALRVGVVEMAALGGAPHAVVDASVRLMRAQRKTEPAAGLANAVLRRVDLARWDALPLPRLPRWLRGPLIEAWGKPAVAAIEAAHAAGAPLDLTPKDGDAAALAARLGGIALPTGSVRLAAAGQVTALEGFETGDWWVQDAAAALPGRVLAPRPGERVLDLCAAPGGKTLQMAAAGAEVTAIDISETRLERLRQNLDRCRLTATVVAADALEWDGAGGFDAVLLDAPCSATGTIRRHPDLPHAKDGSEFMALFALQEALIDRALALLAPGGRLVVCTCSLLPDEGEAQLEAALERHPDLRPHPEALELPGVDPAWRDGTGLRLRPDHWAEAGGMDGFHIASLRKVA
jgi:16S rRNA (cytosine967-C5)-methyltransferase